MSLDRLVLTADNMTSLFLLNRKADDTFSMARGNTDFVLSASFEEYAKCIKNFIQPNALKGSFLYMFPLPLDVKIIVGNPLLLRYCFLGDMAQALAKDASIAAMNLTPLSHIEWSGLGGGTAPTLTANKYKAAEALLMNRLSDAEYLISSRLNQQPYKSQFSLAVLAYASVLSLREERTPDNPLIPVWDNQLSI